MPKKGKAIVTGPTEVVLPFDQKVKDILTLIDEDPLQKEVRPVCLCLSLTADVTIIERQKVLERRQTGSSIWK